MSSAIESVRKWLNQSGFPLEMKAASAFRQAGFEVRQASSYQDPETEKGREIDVLALDPDYIGVTNLAFVLECKASEKPWVVLTSADTYSNFNRIHASAVLSNAALNALTDRLPSPLPDWLRRPNRGGYSFRQAFSKDEDAAFTAAAAVVKACRSFVGPANLTRFSTFNFAFPTIVVSAPLFECELEQNGDLSLIEVQQSEFLFLGYLPDAVRCSVKVVTEAYLPEFADQAKKLADCIRQDFLPAQEKVLASWKQG